MMLGPDLFLLLSFPEEAAIAIDVTRTRSSSTTRRPVSLTTNIQGRVCPRRWLPSDSVFLFPRLSIGRVMHAHRDGVRMECDGVCVESFARLYHPIAVFVWRNTPNTDGRRGGQLTVTQRTAYLVLI